METKRLYLRKICEEDIPAVFEFVRLAEVTRPAGFAPVASLEDEKKALQEQADYYAKREIPKGYGITLKGQDKVIDTIDFNQHPSDDTMEIGYLLHPDYWNQGIMTEAMTALIEVGFTVLNLHKVEVAVYDFNKSSLALVAKFPFQQEAAFRDRKDSIALIYGLGC